MSKKLDRYLQLNRGSSSAPRGRETRADGGSSVQHAVQCSSCTHLTETTDEHGYCPECSARLTANARVYHGPVPELVTGHDGYHINHDAIPSVKRSEKRRHPRIPVRNVKAAIAINGVIDAVVEVLNLSRGGFSFIGFERFSLGTRISVALHYSEGGENIFQEARVVRLRKRASDPPVEYGVELLVNAVRPPTSA